MEGLVVGRKYRLGSMIGSGSFGEVYLGTDLQTKEDVAIKMESVHARRPHLYHEYTVYRAISGTGIPKVRWYGRGKCHYILAMDLLGPTLGDLFKFCGKKFSLKTVLMLADQLIQRIQHIHARGFLYRDLKPENIVMGMGQTVPVVHIIDFGLAKSFRDPKTSRHIRCNVNKGLNGTMAYASLNSHNGFELSRRDDMVSLGYVLIYFLSGSLPWQDLMPEANREQKYEAMRLKKENISIESLCKSYPKEFESYFNRCQSLGFYDSPDYASLRRSFRNLFAREGFQYDNMFDWTILEQQMAQSSRDVPRLPPEQAPPSAIEAPETVKSGGGEGEAEISRTPQL